MQHNIFFEGGAVETMTVIAFAMSALIGFVAAHKTKEKHLFFYAVLTALAAMRELDWHKAWTSDSMLKSRFYLSSDTPVMEKICGGVVICLLIVSALYFLRKIPDLIRGLLSFEPVSWSVGFGFGFLVLGKIIDSAARLWPSLYNILEKDKMFSRMFEESFEMTGAFFFLTALIMMIQKMRTKNNQ